MGNGAFRPSVLERLPPRDIEKVLRQVFRYLSPSDLGAIRLTCHIFNRCACDQLITSLSGMEARLATVEYYFLRRRRNPHSTGRARTPYHRRFACNPENLKDLKDLVLVAQACSAHLSAAGVFPPLPATFHMGVRKIMAILEKHRNKHLLKRTSLTLLRKQFGRYIENCLKMDKPIPPLVVFHTFVYILTKLPGELGTLEQSDDGVRYFRKLPKKEIFMPPVALDSGCPRILLLELIQLSLRAMMQFIRSDQAISVDFNRAYMQNVTGVRVEVTGEVELCLEQLRKSKPSSFTITFVTTKTLDNGLEGHQDVSAHVFQNCGNNLLPENIPPEIRDLNGSLILFKRSVYAWLLRLGVDSVELLISPVYN